ncbi:hypothetical protein ACVMB0_000201 [Bradyrhizobium sp. USDA 4451]
MGGWSKGTPICDKKFRFVPFQRRPAAVASIVVGSRQALVPLRFRAFVCGTASTRNITDQHRAAYKEVGARLNGGAFNSKRFHILVTPYEADKRACAQQVNSLICCSSTRHARRLTRVSYVALDVNSLELVQSRSNARSHIQRSVPYGELPSLNGSTRLSTMQPLTGRDATAAALTTEIRSLFRAVASPSHCCSSLRAAHQPRQTRGGPLHHQISDQD